MFFGMIFITIISWLAAAFGFLIWYYSHKNQRKGLADRMFVAVWICLTAVLVLEGLASYFTQNQFDDYSRWSYYLVELFSQFIYIPAGIYITYLLFNNKKVAYVAGSLYAAVFLLFIIYLFLDGIYPLVGDYFALLYVPAERPQIIFFLSFIPIFVLGTIKLTLYLGDFMKKRINSLNGRYFFYTLSLVVAAPPSLLDQSGLISGWQVGLTRISILIAVLIGFCSVYFKEEEWPNANGNDIYHNNQLADFYSRG